MGSIDAPQTSKENFSTPTTPDGQLPSAGGKDSGGNQPENDTYRRRRSSGGGILSLEVGTRVLCRWRDGKYHPVKVIERRRVHSGGLNDYEYYVHYTECM